ncbi:MAG: DUF3365 domain-containing protein [Aliifodinibius sp.]|nr:DUF3365 domain-containing protein [Fodinibius sp.]
MKRIILLVSVSVFIGTFPGCQSEEKSSDLSSEEAENIETVGDSLSKALLVSLKAALTQAIEDSGIVSAIRVCNTKALPLTEEVSRLTEHAVKIKRTSLKYRNPQNAPDKEEEIVLQYFEKLKEEDTPLPENFLQKVERDADVHYKYYKPIQVGGLCLNCHGDTQQMNPEVVSIINKLYPEDMAKGYQAGDLRGAISITFHEW